MALKLSGKAKPFLDDEREGGRLIKKDLTCTRPAGADRSDD
jgi:hypothetical protein